MSGQLQECGIRHGAKGLPSPHGQALSCSCRMGLPMLGAWVAASGDLIRYQAQPVTIGLAFQPAADPRLLWISVPTKCSGRLGRGPAAKLGT